MAEYVKNYNNGENVIGIEITIDACSLCCYGYYGIGCIQIVKFEADMPYIKDDLRRMQQLISEAEHDLIKAGIPFRPTYGFSNDCLEYHLSENLDLREKYNLRKYELLEENNKVPSIEGCIQEINKSNKQMIFESPAQNCKKNFKRKRLFS